MISDFTRRCDKFGIPVVVRSRKRINNASLSEEDHCTKNWNTSCTALHRVTENLRFSVKRAQFFEHWVFRYMKPVQWPLILCSTRISLEEGMQILEDKQREIDQEWQIFLPGMSIVLRHLVSRIPDDFPPKCNPFEQPLTLIRFWTDQSHSPYADACGFQCSGWATCRAVEKFSELKELDALTSDHLRAHCEGQHKPTHWISFSDDASWILSKKAQNCQLPGARVAIISIPKLERFNIHWGRSDLLFEQNTKEKCFSERNPQGVHYAWPGHYLVYGWTPAQCIIATYSLASFRQACKEHGIQESS